MNTTENNKLLAEFLGKRITSPSNLYEFIQWKDKEQFNFITTYNHLELKFHSDWNWLMIVLEKIESLGYWIEILGGYHQEFRIGKINQTKEFINKDSSDKIEAVYNACIEFVKWWNKEKGGKRNS